MVEIPKEETIGVIELNPIGAGLAPARAVNESNPCPGKQTLW